MNKIQVDGVELLEVCHFGCSAGTTPCFFDEHTKCSRPKDRINCASSLRADRKSVIFLTQEAFLLAKLKGDL